MIYNQCIDFCLNFKTILKTQQLSTHYFSLSPTFSSNLLNPIFDFMNEYIQVLITANQKGKERKL